MKYVLIIVAITLAACKKCQQAAHYVVPMYLEISPAPTLRIGLDTLTVMASVPYYTADLRLPGYPVSVKKFKPSDLYFSFTAHPSNGEYPIPPIVPFLDGYFELVPLRGKQKGNNLLFEFLATDTAWVVEFMLIPKKPFAGIYNLGSLPIQYKDQCMQIDPVTVLTNTQTSHYLVSERLSFQFSPRPNDVILFVN